MTDLQLQDSAICDAPDWWSGGDPSSGASRAGSATMIVIGTSSPALLYGLESLVHTTAGVLLGGSASSLERFMDCCLRAGECVALVDPFLGRQGVRDFMATLKSTVPKTRAVLMTNAHQPHVVREAVKSGACGFLGKTAGVEEIRVALLAVAAGRRYISPEIAAHLAESLTFEDLTAREMEVLGLLSQGQCNKSIAQHLDLTVGTVKTHVRAIMCKLGVRSRSGAIPVAIRRGLVSVF